MKKKITIALLAAVFAALLVTGARCINLIKAQGYQALKVFAYAKNIKVMDDFNTYETPHFIIRYADKDENVIRNIARLFEEGYTAINEEYSYTADQKMTVFIYQDQETMWEYQSAVRGQAVMGFYSMGMMHILSPNAYDQDKTDFVDFFKKNGPILHEYTHKVIDDKTGGNIELWVTEGLALYEECEKLGIQWSPDFQYDFYYKADDLRNNFMYLDEEQAYKQSFDAITLLVDRYGKDKLLSVLDLLGQGYDLDIAFTEIYGFSADNYLNEKFTEWMPQQ